MVGPPIATAILVSAQRAIYGNGSGATDPTYVRYTILFSSIIFNIVGFSTIVISCTQCGATVLMAGGSLLIGGFFGLLFGYPSGVASQPVNPQASRITPANQSTPTPDRTNQNTTPTGQPGQETPFADQTGQNAASVGATATQSQGQDRNLLAEASSTLGKLLTGFTLAKANSIKLFASTLCHRIGPAFGPDDRTNFLMAGAMLVFFLATGFVSGLLLPSYFMSGKFAD